MAFPFPLVRLILYASLFLWSFLLFVLCIARLAYTNSERDEPSLNGGHPFYDPSVVELLVSSMFAIAFVPTMWLVFRRRITSYVPTRSWFEIVALLLLWLFFIGGAGAAVNVWPDLSWCTQYGQCRLLQAIMGFAWLSWISITLLLMGSLIFAGMNRTWREEAVDLWGSMGSVRSHK